MACAPATHPCERLIASMLHSFFLRAAHAIVCRCLSWVRPQRRLRAACIETWSVLVALAHVVLLVPRLDHVPDRCDGRRGEVVTTLRDRVTQLPKNKMDAVAGKAYTVGPSPLYSSSLTPRPHASASPGVASTSLSQNASTVASSKPAGSPLRICAGSSHIAASARLRALPPPGE